MSNLPDYSKSMLSNATLSATPNLHSAMTDMVSSAWDRKCIADYFNDSICFKKSKQDHDVHCVQVQPTQIVLQPVKEARPEPECIMTNEKLDKILPDGTIKPGGIFTTVKWKDGTYTTVKASKDDCYAPSPYMAFCAALAKKLYGSNAAVHRMVNHHTQEYLETKKAAEAAEQRAKEREAEQDAHERALLREAKRLRLKAEAKAYNAAHSMDKE